MSRITVSGQGQVYSLNVISFSSPIFAQVNSVQTKTLAVHFPIKMAQPSLNINVQFANETDFQVFQNFVRNHQQQVVQDATTLLTFNWPDRSIINNTGVIPRFKAGGMRANYAPMANFEIYLVDSITSARTDIASLAANWNSIYGGLGGGGGVLQAPTAGQLLGLGLLQPGQNIATALASSLFGGNASLFGGITRGS
jgi:hypothetical protein